MIWKLLTLVFAIASIVLCSLLIQRNLAHRALSEPRLVGTWVSDKERTLEHLPETQKEKLGKFFGKLKITYTESTYTTELDDKSETAPYTVLGLDKHSVVIRDDSTPDPGMAMFEISTFTKIHFEGSDSYWITCEFGGFAEYFRRVNPDKT